MAIKLFKGKTKLEWMPVTTSTALSANSLVTYTSGLLVAATSTTASVDVQGVLVKAIVSTDTDYATARLVEVRVPVEKNTVWEMDVTSGLVATDIGAEVDMTDASTVNRAASSVKVVRAVRVLSTTKGHFKLKQLGSY